MNIATPSPCQSDIPLLNTKLTRTKTRKINMDVARYGRSFALKWKTRDGGEEKASKKLAISIIMQFINSRPYNNHKRRRECNSSCSFTTEFLGPFRVPLEVFITDCWSGAADRLDKVLEYKCGFEELVRFDIDPGHLRCTLVSR